MQIKECMTENVSFVEPDTQIPQIARRIRDEDIGALPIVEGDRLIRHRYRSRHRRTDRRERPGRSHRHGARSDVAKGSLLFRRPDGRRGAREHGATIEFGRLPVVNREKRLVGVVSPG